jgi:hypothetical protein
VTIRIASWRHPASSDGVIPHRVAWIKGHKPCGIVLFAVQEPDHLTVPGTHEGEHDM